MTPRKAFALTIIGVAAVAFGVYWNRYRTTSSAQIRVLVANRLIEEGTSGNVIRSTVGYKVVIARTNQIEARAIVDPSTLIGKVAVKDIPRGQQLIGADFDQLGKRRVLFPGG